MIKFSYSLALLFFSILRNHLVISTEYDYNGNGSLAAWKDKGVCSIGISQSPIDIVPSSMNQEPVCKYISFKFLGPVVTNTTNNGHSLYVYGEFLQIEIFSANQLSRIFKSAQFHLHAVSEHTVNGDHYDLELHLVNKQTDAARYAVFGIFFKVSEEEHIPEAKIFKKMIVPSGTYSGANIFTEQYELDFQAVFNLVFITGQKLYTYEGSLTTPNCTEIVSWHVFKNPLPISEATYEKVKELWYEGEEKGNYRVTFPLNGREVTYNKICISAIRLLSSVIIMIVIPLF